METTLTKFKRVRDQLTQIIEAEEKRINTPKERIDFIVTTVCDWFSVNRRDLERKTRKREIVDPRQITMALLKRNTNLSLFAIGTMFGGRDHTTVIHAMQTVSDLCDSDPFYKETFDLLERKIQ